jgi:pilus assembly protein CpaE
MGLPSGQPGKVIAVYSPKGGTGCTTLATNLAVALQSDENPVVLVDGNMEFGDVAVFLNEQAKNSIVDLAPRADELDPDIIEEVLVKHNPSGVKILVAPARPEYAESVTGEQFGKVLDYLRQMFAYVVVDTASSLTDVTLAVIDQSDLIVLITTQDIPAIKNARLFLDLAGVLKISRERIIFVMNRFDKRIGITPEKISENFKHEVAAVLPLEERTVVPSVNRGVPFMVDDRLRPIARSFLAFVDKVQLNLAEPEAEDQREGAKARPAGWRQ